MVFSRRARTARPRPKELKGSWKLLSCVRPRLCTVFTTLDNRWMIADVKIGRSIMRAKRKRDSAQPKIAKRKRDSAQQKIAKRKRDSAQPKIAKRKRDSAQPKIMIRDSIGFIVVALLIVGLLGLAGWSVYAGRKVVEELPGVQHPILNALNPADAL